MKQDIKNITFSKLNLELPSLGLRRYAPRQIFDWLYKKRVNTFKAMSNLSKQDISILENRFYIKNLNLIKKLISKDKTQKFLFELSDKALPSKEKVRPIPVDKQVIETVFIPSERRNTVCLSSQVGCRFKCLFCASGTNFVRSLTVSEITGQLSEILDVTKTKVTHLVFMGIGEPLDNYDNVLDSIRIFNDPAGFNIGARRITISSCGIIPKIKRLEDEGLQVELSISLHAAEDKLRDKLMPVNKKYPLGKLILRLKDYIKSTNRQVTFEYVLIKGVNDKLTDADRLSKLISGLKCKVNLILFNTGGSDNFDACVKEDIIGFKNRLIANGTHTILRISRGADISAACGQLRIQHN